MSLATKGERSFGHGDGNARRTHDSQVHNIVSHIEKRLYRNSPSGDEFLKTGNLFPDTEETVRNSQFVESLCKAIRGTPRNHPEKQAKTPHHNQPVAIPNMERLLLPPVSIENHPIGQDAVRVEHHSPDRAKLAEDNR
jgi:hypothetical protein